MKETIICWDRIVGVMRPHDAFLVRMGGEGFDTRIVVGRDQANTAFALLFGDMGDDNYQRYLEYAADDDNWGQQEGDVIDLRWSGEAGWCDISRITFEA